MTTKHRPIDVLSEVVPGCNLISLLNTVHAPDSFRGLRTAISGFLRDLNQANEELKAFALEDLQQEVQDCAIRISELPSQTSTDLMCIEIQSDPGRRRGARTRANLMMFHGIELFPSYGACCTVPETPTAARRFSIVRGLYVLGQAHLALQHHGFANFRADPFLPPPFSTAAAGRAVRHLSYAKNEAILHALPLDESIPDLAKHLRAVSRQDLDLSPLAVLLEKSYQGRPHVRRPRSADGTSCNKTLIDGSLPPVDRLLEAVIRPPQSRPQEKDSGSLPFGDSFGDGNGSFKGRKSNEPTSIPTRIGEFVVTDNRDTVLRAIRRSRKAMADQRQRQAQDINRLRR